jgi:hypothetical protein
MNIPTNDGVLTNGENKAVEDMANQILKQLENSSTAQVYMMSSGYGEPIARIVGKEFAKKGYHVAYDYVPNGYRNITVSKMPIGEPSGRLVSRRWE